MASGSSLAKMLSLLDLFEERPEWQADDLGARTGYTRSTLYRYTKALTDAGLLTSYPGSGFMLGPRIVELDYRLRTGDVLIGLSRPYLQRLAEDAPGVALLCRRYRDTVLCIDQAVGPTKVRSSYERGKAMDLGRGAASKVILAFLSSAQLRAIHRRRQADFAQAGLGADLAAVRAAMRDIRSAGHSVSSGEVTPGVTGVAAPVLDARGAVLASVSVTVAGRSLARGRIDVLVKQVQTVAEQISAALGRIDTQSGAS